MSVKNLVSLAHYGCQELFCYLINFYYHWLVGQLAPYLTHIVTHAMVISRLDNCNLAYARLPLNPDPETAASTKCHSTYADGIICKDCIQPMPIEYQIHPKVLSFKTLRGQGPVYLLDFLFSNVPYRDLHSEYQYILVIFGQRHF